MATGHPDLDQRVAKIADRLVKTKLLWKNNHANISIKIPGTNEFILTGGVMEPFDIESLTRLTLDGELLAGKLAPQAQEIVDMHAVVYRKRPEIGGIVHTHSPHATAYAVASKELACFTNSLARLDIAESIPVSPFGPRGSEIAVQHIANTLDAHPGCRALLLANHGVLTFDKTPEEASQMAFAVEENAEVAILAGIVGTAKPIPPEMIHAASERLKEFAKKGEAVG